MLPVYESVAHNVSKKWAGRDQCGLVTGVTYPEEIGKVREIVGDGAPLLIPGLGTQGGVLRDVLHSGLDSNGQGLILNYASSVIYSEDVAKTAGDLHMEIVNTTTSLLDEQAPN